MLQYDFKVSLPETNRFPRPCLFLQVNGEKERLSLLVSRGSVDAVSQQMASHPQYLESFLRTQHYILHMDGPLPLPYRHYIAIMVSDLDFLSRIHPNSSPAVIMHPNIHKAFFFEFSPLFL